MHYVTLELAGKRIATGTVEDFDDTLNMVEREANRLDVEMCEIAIFTTGNITAEEAAAMFAEDAEAPVADYNRHAENVQDAAWQASNF